MHKQCSMSKAGSARERLQGRTYATPESLQTVCEFHQRFDEWLLQGQIIALHAVGMLDYCQLKDRILIATAALVEARSCLLPVLCHECYKALRRHSTHQGVKYSMRRNKPLLCVQ